MGPVENMLIYSLAMIVLPVGGFFSSKTLLFEGFLGYNDGSAGGAIIAVVLIHVVIAMFVYKAWTEGQSTTSFKQD